MSGVAGSYSNSTINFLRNGHTLFQSDSTNLCFHECIPVFTHTSQCLLLSVLLVMATLLGVKGYLTVVMISISLMINDVDHLPMFLLASCVSP